MTELMIFAAAMAGFAIYDLRKMLRERLTREPAVYCAVCLLALAVAIFYFPALSRRSIIGFLLRLVGMRG